MKKIAACIIAVAVAALAIFVIYDATKSKPLTNNFFSMNTYVSAQVEGKNAEENLVEIKKTIENLDLNVLSRTSENSVIYNLNKNGEALLDTETAAYFSLLADISKQSGGAFDYTLGAVSDLWNFGGTPSVPDEVQLSEALAHSGYEKIAIANGKATMADKAAVIDFGASGKGIALDCVKTYLETQKTERAVISVGGSVLLYGEGDFTVGIRNPRGDSGSYIATLTIPENCVSTSGSYEQSFEQDGKKYHHILDPETGYPVDNGLVSVTVISESGLISDALSTACFVLGMEKGSDLAEEYGATVIFITEDNLIHTKNSEILNISNPDYSLAED